MSKLVNCLKNLGKIILDIIIVVLVGAVLIAFYGTYQTKILDNDYANYFGYTYFRVSSGSMEDSLYVDDYVIVELTKDVDVSDIVSFKNHDEIITHRVIEKNDENIVTKGDANPGIDEPVPYDNLIGKVIFTLKEFGIFYKVITTPVVYISFFVTIILFSILFDGKKEVKKDEEEKNQ
jgi:signal peptidase